jgi:hypothetical protein
VESVDAKAILEKFETFLATIPLDRYREELEPVKTVEQDLPKDLNPLPAIYDNYWVSSVPEKFPDYEDFFCTWWTDHLRPLDDFIQKYFWGCSRNFVYLGFKARLYRTLISVLTQFHFAYSWKAYCQLELEASAELDMNGIDALVHCEGKRIGLQIKKETYRSEARESGRFAPRRIHVDIMIEIPYTIVKPDEWEKRMQRALKSDRQKQDRQKQYELYKLFFLLAKKLQRWLDNGFVVFQPDYPRLVERFIQEKIKEMQQQEKQEKQKIGWQETLKYIGEWLEL